MYSIKELQALHSSRNNEFQRRVGELKVLSSSKSQLGLDVEHLNLKVEQLGKVLVLFHSLSTTVQARFINGIESLVSEGLSAVFEEEIHFKITVTTRSKQVNLDFSLLNSDGTETDLVDARGGGLVSLCGILLRLIMTRLMSEKIRQVVIMDEPLGMLSTEYQQGAGELLHKLADKLNMQIIMVTHNLEVVGLADKMYELKRNGTEVDVVPLG